MPPSCALYPCKWLLHKQLSTSCPWHMLHLSHLRAKKGTTMELHPEPSLDELLWSVAAARIIFGPSMNIQAPPNLTPVEEGAAGAGVEQVQASWRALLDAGINDWGGSLLSCRLGMHQLACCS